MSSFVVFVALEGGCVFGCCVLVIAGQVWIGMGGRWEGVRSFSDFLCVWVRVSLEYCGLGLQRAMFGLGGLVHHRLRL